MNQIIQLVPAAPGMYAVVDGHYELVINWVHTGDTSNGGQTDSIVGMTVTDVGKPFAEWSEKTTYTSNPDRSRTIYR